MNSNATTAICCKLEKRIGVSSFNPNLWQLYYTTIQLYNYHRIKGNEPCVKYSLWLFFIESTAYYLDFSITREERDADCKFRSTKWQDCQMK